MRPLLLMASFFSLLVTLGCGPAGNAVVGTIQFQDGTPLETGELIFDDGTYSDIASIESEGKFQVEKGLPPGTYKVTLGGVMLPNEQGSYASIVHPKYLEYQSTDLSLTVPVGDTPIQLVIDGPKK